MLKSKRVVSLLVALTVAVTSMVTVAIPTVAEAKTAPPKKVSTPTVRKNVSGKAIVYWKDIKGQDGYQISQSTSKKKTNIVATYKTRIGNSKIVKAKNNKRYYYKVRAYKNTKVNGKLKKIYGSWSNVKSYTVKKSAPSHTHKWKNHIAKKKVWVSKWVKVPVYEYKRVKAAKITCLACGKSYIYDGSSESHMDIDQHFINHENDGDYKGSKEEVVYIKKKVKVGTKRVDKGHYVTKKVVDYQYCKCGARK